MKLYLNTIVLTLLTLAFLSPVLDAQVDTKKPSGVDRIARAARNMNRRQRYLLAYKLNADETVRWTVEHVASTKTQMSGVTEETSSRSVSTKTWKISSVDNRGNFTFVHSIESVDMWQKIGDADPISYNSKTDKEIPELYQGTADTIGKPLAVISLSANGQIVDKKSSLKNARFGTGDVAVPLPKQPIPVGHKWHVATDLQGTDEDGRNRLLKARIAYELVKVKDGNAYISFRTEVLTPIESQKIKSQIMQQMTKGYLVFSIADGRHVRKEVEWDEKVQGFAGPDSFLQYLGRMTEKLVDGNSPTPDAKTAVLQPMSSPTKVAQKAVKIKTRDGKPIMRK